MSIDDFTNLYPMKKTHKITIKSILDLETGEEIESIKFFNQSLYKIFQLRSEIESDIQNGRKRYVCYFCKQHIKIRGKRGGVQTFHFAHLKDSKDCPIKTDSKYSKEEILRMKYNGAKESEPHNRLKGQIEYFLKENERTKGEIEQVLLETIKKDEMIPLVWKKPDVSAVHLGKKLVFELQLSTTFLSVIVSRQDFYKRNRNFIFWIFNEFEIEKEKRRFMQSDIFYTNNQNAFEFNSKTLELSKIEQDLVLCCYYQHPYRDNYELKYNWSKEYVKLSDLTFDFTNYKAYYFDVATVQAKIQKEINLDVENRRREDEQIKLEEEQRRRSYERELNLSKWGRDWKFFFTKEEYFYNNKELIIADTLIKRNGIEIVILLQNKSISKQEISMIDNFFYMNDKKVIWLLNGENLGLRVDSKPNRRKIWKNYPRKEKRLFGYKNEKQYYFETCYINDYVYKLVKRQGNYLAIVNRQEKIYGDKRKRILEAENYEQHLKNINKLKKLYPTLNVEEDRQIVTETIQVTTGRKTVKIERCSYEDIPVYAEIYVNNFKEEWVTDSYENNIKWSRGFEGTASQCFVDFEQDGLYHVQSKKYFSKDRFLEKYRNF